MTNPRVTTTSATPTTSTTTISLPDGRHVAIDLTGPAGAPAVVLLHPAPGSRRFDPVPDTTASAAVRLVSIDRPGYGGSDPLAPGTVPTITGFAADAAAVLDALGIADAAVVGWSAGGRVAAALAAKRPELVRALVLAATPAPDDEVPWIGEEQRPFIGLMKSDPVGCLPALVGQLGDMAEVPADALVAAGPADAAALAGDDGLAARLDAMVAEGFVQGAIGLALDLVSYTAVPWGFDPAAVGAPTVCIYGVDDPTVPPAHGRWWASRIPDADVWEVPATGHLVLGPVWNRLLAGVLAR